MEVVSTSNLVSSQSEKTTAALFSQLHDGRTPKKNRKNTYKQNSKIKTDQSWAKRKNVVFFENALSFASKLIRAKEGW